MKCTLWTRRGILLIFCLLCAGSIVGGTANSSSDELKVALLDAGSIGDHGWVFEGHIGGMKMAEKLPYVNLSERESASGDNASKIMREYADNGYKLIFCHGDDFRDAILDVAPKYPRVIFMWGAGTEKLAPNVGIYSGRIYQAEFLAGIVTGNMTKTNKIAFVASVLNPEVVRAINALAKGVAIANPRAKVYVEWVGSWYDPEKERQTALDLINNGCDVITHTTDSDTVGQVAEETGTYYLSYGSNTNRFFHHVFLTGGVWNWGPIMTDITESVHNGTWTSHPNQNWWYGIEEGGIELAPLSDIVPNNVIMFEKVKQDEIVKGELTVFPGMSDEELFKMNYLEPNVVGVLPKS